MNEVVLKSKIDFIVENDLVFNTFQMYVYDTFINGEKIDEDIKSSIDLSFFNDKIYTEDDSVLSLDISSHGLCDKLFKDEDEDKNKYKKIKIEFKDKPFKLMINIFKTNVVCENKDDDFSRYYFISFKGSYEEEENKKTLESIDLNHKSNSSKLFLDILANYIRDNIDNNDEVIVTLYE